MRYIVYGAGAVGGVIGGKLFQAGHDVSLIARGDHLQALQARGLELQLPDGIARLPIPAFGAPDELEILAADVVILAMKGQHTLEAVEALAATAPPEVAVVCAQNGVENERVALRRFPNVYGMNVFLPASHLEPGVVQGNGSPLAGMLDVGCYPNGVNPTAEKIAADLDGSGLASMAVPDIMRHKYAKLLVNLGNALEAAAGPAGRESDLGERARTEARAVLDAAGIAVATPEETRARRGDLVQLKPVAGQRRAGGSSWQSLARGAGNIEADYLNGEIVLLGRLFGIPTPVNEALQRVANDLARRAAPPGSVPVDALLAGPG